MGIETKYYIDYTDSNKILPIIGLQLHQTTEDSDIQKKKFKINTESDLQRIKTIASMMVCSNTDEEFSANEKGMIQDSSKQEDGILLISSDDSSGIVMAPVTIQNTMFLRIKSLNTFKHIDEVFSNGKSETIENSFKECYIESPEQNHADYQINNAQASDLDDNFNYPEENTISPNLEHTNYEITLLEDQPLQIDTINIEKKQEDNCTFASEYARQKNYNDLKKIDLDENFNEKNSALTTENKLLNRKVLEYEKTIAELTVKLNESKGSVTVYENRIQEMITVKDNTFESEVKILKDRLINSMNSTQKLKISYEDLNLRYYKQLWETEKMTKLYENIESMYLRVSKRNNQLEMECLTGNLSKEVDNLLFPEIKSDTKKPDNILPQENSIKHLPIIKFYLPENLKNLNHFERPKSQKPQSQDKERFSNGLLSHELPTSKIKQIDNNPKKIEDFWDNKMPKLTGIMIKNKREGLWKEFNRNGQILFETNYLNGKKHGICKEWYPKGILRQEGTFKNGLKDGFVILYKPDKDIKEKGYYKDGKIVKNDCKNNAEFFVTPNDVLNKEEDYESDIDEI